MAYSPLRSSDRPEHTRTNRLKQVIIVRHVALARLVLALGAAWLWWLAAPWLQPVHAEAPGTAAISVVPADGKTRGIQLRAQTVDATITQDAGGVWADTRVWVQLYNPGNQPVVVPIALPGPQLGASALPDGLEVTADNKHLELQPFQPQKDGPVIGQTAPITITTRGAVSLLIRYRQALAEKDGLVTFTYPLTSTLRWSGTPESLRVTVRFDPPAALGQVLARAPAAQLYDPDGMTWHLEYQRAAQSIGVAFMSPAWWAGFDAARAAAAATGAGPTQHLALSEYYRHLSALPAPPFDSRADFPDRYYPAEDAALLAVLRGSPSSPGPIATADEQLTAHTRLAELYRGRAEQPDGSADEAYLQMAAAEMEAAVTLDGGNADLREGAANLNARLAQAAQARGDSITAAQRQARLDALRVPGGAANDRSLAQATALARATQALEAGDSRQARQLIVEAFGPMAVTLQSLPPPFTTQALVSVTTTPTERIFGVQLSGDGAAPAASLAQAAQALSACPPTRIVAAGVQLTVTLTYTGAAELRESQACLAAALPSIPELTLLAAALAPQQLEREIMQDPFKATERYVERVDLGSALRAWESLAAQLELASQGEGPAAVALLADPRLAQLQRAFWAEDAAAWRSLADRSRVSYRVEMNAVQADRGWEVRPGEARTLEATAGQLRWKQIAAVAVAAAFLLVLVAYLIWRRL